MVRRTGFLFFHEKKGEDGRNAWFLSHPEIVGIKGEKGGIRKEDSFERLGRLREEKRL